MSKLTPQHVHGEIDLGNSTSTPLAGGAVFTGEWLDITDYGIIYVNVYTDVASATDGLCIEQSSDGTNADHDDCFTIAAGSAKNFAVNPHSQYLRVIYTNGGSVQGAFRLQTKLNTYGLASSHRIKDDITTDDDARLVKSVLSIKSNDLDEYKNVEVNNPIPVNSGQLYQSDINLTHSNMYTFSGSPIDLLDDRWTTVVDSTATNPKQILLEFERPLQTSIIGVATASGSFSNTVIKYGVVGTPSITILDESADATAKQIAIAPSTPITLTKILIEFHTANTCTVSAVNLGKATNSISQLQGQTDNNELINIGATTGGNLRVTIQEYGDTAAIDAFDRLRVSNPFTIFDSKQLYDKQPLFYDEITGGSATSTHSTTHARTRMTVTSSSSDYVIRQTKQRFNYQPGKSELLFLTFYAPQETGCTKRIGLFDSTASSPYMTANNGIFLSIGESSVSLNIAKNGSTTETITQANWNVDPLDGTGPSGLTIDFDATQIFVCDFEWLGVGRVRCGFVIGGIAYYAHYFNHANDSTYTAVYMSSPNLPVRYDIASDGTGGGDLDHICATVISEGGVELTGVSRAIDTENTHIDANTADTPYVVLALRLKTTHLDLTVLPQTISMISETNDDFRWSLLLNPTYNGTLTYGDISNSGCQYAAGATANNITAQGTKLASGYAKSAGTTSANIINNLRIGSLIDGTRDELILAVTPCSSNADYQASLTFRELL